jgi:hypothetical protein
LEIIIISTASSINKSLTPPIDSIVVEPRVGSVTMPSLDVQLTGLGSSGNQFLRFLPSLDRNWCLVISALLHTQQFILEQVLGRSTSIVNKINAGLLCHIVVPAWEVGTAFGSVGLRRLEGWEGTEF